MPSLSQTHATRTTRSTIGRRLRDTVLPWLLGGLLVPAVLAWLMATMGAAKTIAIVAGVIGLGITLAKPRVGLVLFIALLYVRPEEVFPALAGMRLALLISLVTLIGLVYGKLISREALMRSPLNGMIGGFCLMTALSAATTGNMGQAIMDISKLGLLVWLVLNLAQTTGAYRTLVSAVLVFSGYLAAYSIYLYFAGGALHQDGLLRSQATGIFNDPNDLAATMVAGLAFAVARLFQPGKSARIAYGGLAALMLWAILLTNSRGGMIALLFVAGGCFVVFCRNRVLSVGLSIFAVVTFLALGPSRMTSFDSKEESANSRFWFWDNGLEQLREHPLLGVGYNQFPDVNNGMTAHNSFVLCFAETGLLGYFFWTGGLYYAFKPGNKGGVKGNKRGIEGKTEDGEKTLNAECQKPNTQPRIPNTDLLGARLALAGYLAAAFWLSETYTPILYLLVSLAVAARHVGENAASPSQAADANMRATVTEKDAESVGSGVSANSVQDWVRIAFLCLASIAFIYLFVQRFK